MEERLILTGFMGTGKTSVARALARRLSWKMVDLDELIESREGRKITLIFESDGEEKFRQLETRALKDALEIDKAVISCGGGILLREENRKMLAGENVINLHAPFSELRKRIGSGRTRPLARAGKGELEKLYEKRRHLYDAVDKQVDTVGKTADKVASEIISRFLGREDGALS